jgi:hypothetical protein
MLLVVFSIKKRYADPFDNFPSLHIFIGHFKGTVPRKLPVFTVRIAEPEPYRSAAPGVTLPAPTMVWNGRWLGMEKLHKI